MSCPLRLFISSLSSEVMVVCRNENFDQHNPESKFIDDFFFDALNYQPSFLWKLTWRLRIFSPARVKECRIDDKGMHPKFIEAVEKIKDTLREGTLGIIQLHPLDGYRLSIKEM